jgi:hypothetical protein
MKLLKTHLWDYLGLALLLGLATWWMDTKVTRSHPDTPVWLRLTLVLVVCYFAFQWWRGIRDLLSGALRQVLIFVALLALYLLIVLGVCLVPGLVEHTVVFICVMAFLPLVVGALFGRYLWSSLQQKLHSLGETNEINPPGTHNSVSKPNAR